MFTCVLDAVFLLLSYYSTTPFGGGADSVCGQMLGDKECSFSGVTNFGRVLRKGVRKRCQREVRRGGGGGVGAEV